MMHEDLAETVPRYAIGALERIERQALEAHLLSGCIPCRTALKEFQSVAVALPFALTIVEPPRTLKAKIIGARTQAHPTETESDPSVKPSLEPGEWMKHLFPPSSPATASFGWALGTVIVGVLSLLIVVGLNTSSRVVEDASKLAELQTQAEAAGAKLATIQQQVSEHEEVLAQTREELQRRTAQLAEIRDQLIQREVEVDDLKAQLAQRSGRPVRIP
jgi:hypothetical protein